MTSILIIDDEPQIRRFLQIGLSSQGYQIFESPNGGQGLSIAALEVPDMIILDLGLPDIDGQDVLKQLREFYSGPIIVLSVRNSENEKVTALDSGANDYMVKPFGIKELLARIRSLLRLYGDKQAISPVFDDGNLHIDLANRRVHVGEDEVKLSRKEFDLLRMLMTYSGRIVTQQQLLKEIWGDSHAEDSHYLRIFIGKIRTKLGDDPSNPKYIETEPGVGYRFLPTV